MSVPCGTTIKAALVAGRLLESDLEFHGSLTTKEGTLSINKQDAAGVYTEAEGTLELWWGVEIEARSWGIKDMSVYIRKLVLDGRVLLADAEGDMQETDDTFHYEHPTTAAPASEIGSDPDAPTPGNVEYLSTPKWELKYGLTDPHRTTIYPSNAEVDLDRHIIEIEF